MNAACRPLEGHRPQTSSLGIEIDVGERGGELALGPNGVGVEPLLEDLAATAAHSIAAHRIALAGDPHALREGFLARWRGHEMTVVALERAGVELAVREVRRLDEVLHECGAVGRGGEEEASVVAAHDDVVRQPWDDGVEAKGSGHGARCRSVAHPVA